MKCADESTWLDDGVRLLEAISRVSVPERYASVVASADQHSVVVQSESIQRAVVSTEILQEPVCIIQLEYSR
jgi:hypothetical protein